MSTRIMAGSNVMDVDLQNYESAGVKNPGEKREVCDLTLRFKTGNRNESITAVFPSVDSRFVETIKKMKLKHLANATVNFNTSDIIINDVARPALTVQPSAIPTGMNPRVDNTKTNTGKSTKSKLLG